MSGIVRKELFYLRKCASHGGRNELSQCSGGNDLADKSMVSSEYKGHDSSEIYCSLLYIGNNGGYKTSCAEGISRIPPVIVAITFTLVYSFINCIERISTKVQCNL